MAQISVIVPVYKVESYIHRCVDSILAQTFSDFELILVDDGSPDNCGAICDEYAEQDKRVRVLHRNNHGVSAARNAGLDWVFANSDSKYIGFVDSDDWVHPRFLELLHKAIEQFHVNIAQCRFIRTDGTMDVPEVSETMKLITPTEHYRDYYSGAVWNKLFSRECWRNRRFPVGQIYGEDVAVWYKILLEETHIALVDERVYYYFQREESVMKSAWVPKYLERMHSWNKQQLYIDKHGDADLREAALNWYCKIGKAEYRAIERSTALSENEKKQYQAALRKKFRQIWFRHKKEMKQNPKYKWMNKTAILGYRNFCKSVNEKLDWCYWFARGVLGKPKRMYDQYFKKK